MTYSSSIVMILESYSQKLPGRLSIFEHRIPEPMNAKQLTPDFSVSGQIGVSDLAKLSAQGFRSIICNRPGNEDAYQPSFADISRAADKAGLRIRYIPVVSGRVTETDVAQFVKAIDELPSPVLAYCHMGVRSAMMWALSQAGKRPMNEIATTIRNAGL